jgi:hypothetical protein
VDRERIAVLVRPLVHVHDLRTDAILFEEQSRDETDRTRADDEDLRIGVTDHRQTLLTPPPYSTRDVAATYAVTP